MKIALLTDGIFPYVIGGMQKHSYYLAKFLAQKGVDVDLYHTNQSKYDINRLELFNQEEKSHIRSFVVDFPKHNRLPGHYVRESYEYSSKLYELFSHNTEVDFIYCKGFSGWKLIEEKEKGKRLPPVGINFHGYEMFQQKSGLELRLANLLLKGPVKYNTLNADYVFSYGGKITPIIRSIGVKDENIIEIPTGIEASWLTKEVAKPEQKRRFIFVGRHERRKGIDELNQAISQLLGKYDFAFEFVGPIPEDKKLISDKVLYHGIVTDQYVMKKLMETCDVLICPSYAEGMPNVIMEALASGLAVIATDVGAVREMVSEENGWLLSSPDVEEILKTLVKAIEMPEQQLTEKKEKAVAMTRERFLWDHVIEQTLFKIQQKIESISQK